VTNDKKMFPNLNSILTEWVFSVKVKKKKSIATMNNKNSKAAHINLQKELLLCSESFFAQKLPSIKK
jgi:hypothetical protein